MILSKLLLTDFRSYRKAAITLSPDVTLLTGINTSGKTNILEAIHVLATGKSFRAAREAEMIRFGSQIGRVKGTTDDGMFEVVITTGDVGGQKTPVKRYLVNGVPRRPVDFVGNVPAVLFWPEDLALVIDSPSIRRRYLDRVLVQADREYRRSLLSYERGLRQRNRLLDRIAEGEAQRSQLLFWDQLLIRDGGYLTGKRAEFVGYINRQRMEGFPYRIGYDKSVISESRIAQYAREEVAARATLVGPHRDNLVFFKESGTKSDDVLDLASYGSRGEQRLAILWLKLAELAYMSESVGSRPILLLDDIFSELDPENRLRVLALTKTLQTVITSAETDTAGMLREAGVTYSEIRLPVV